MDTDRREIQPPTHETLIAGARDLSAAVKAQTPLRGRALKVRSILLPTSAIGEAYGAGEIGPPLKLKSEIGSSGRGPRYRPAGVGLLTPLVAPSA